ncbi:hypothetical protein SAMN04488069_11933 [Hymenobacter psychrophilus]|uniref:Uncharacterized protein n=1 Tax=Hymenobacter psychrophilus TaxID=651662 RepID=A0A1H3NVU4_9BACT|nr:hypothetical protein SAMN04488069_11933 [Hymenobacter psychrophilus]
MNIDDLLVPRHPLPRLHEQQVQALQQLPETERAEQAQLLRVGNAAYRYHQLERVDTCHFSQHIMQASSTTALYEAAVLS